MLASALAACDDIDSRPFKSQGRAQWFPPPDGPEDPAPPGDRIRVRIDCGGGVVDIFGDLVEQLDGRGQVDLEGLLPAGLAGLCQVDICIVDEAGACVPHCQAFHGEDIEVREGAHTPVEVDLICVEPFPGRMNVRVSVTAVRPDVMFVPGKDLTSCGGMTALRFVFEDGFAPPEGHAYAFSLMVADPALADRVRIEDRGDDTFRIVGLAHGERHPGRARDGFVPLRGTLTIGELVATLDTHVYVRGDAPCQCIAAEPEAVDIIGWGEPGPLGCDVADGRLSMRTPALDGDEHATCRLVLPDPFDISGIAAAPDSGARLGVELCNPGDRPAAGFLSLRSQAPDPRFERVGAEVTAPPGGCVSYPIDYQELALDPDSHGQFRPARVDEIELTRLGPQPGGELRLRLAMACCAPDDDLNPRLECCGGEAGGAELCDAWDNDCDGATDEGYPVGEACWRGLGLCAREGALACAPDGREVTCDAVAGPPAPEICDGSDNDCDGQTDEGVRICGECQRPVARTLTVLRGAGGCCDGYDRISHGETARSDRFDLADGERVRVTAYTSSDGHIGCLSCDDPRNAGRCADPEPQENERLRVYLRREGGASILLGDTRDRNGQGQSCAEGSDAFAPVIAPEAGRYEIHVEHTPGGAGSQSVVLREVRVAIDCP